MANIWSLLQARARTAGAAPLITYIDSDSGERTELSATSVANAAAKIANALRDEFELEAGASVALGFPVHWQRSTWLAGVWTAGCRVLPGLQESDLLVTTPALSAEATRVTSAPVVVVSMHPFGLPITEPMPDGVVDVTLAVRQQPDAFLYEPPDATLQALALEGAFVTQAEALDMATDLAAARGLARGGRLLVTDAAPSTTSWLSALAVPLAMDASVVLMHGIGNSDAVAEQERITCRMN